MDWLSDDERSLLLCGNVLERMEDIASESVQCCVTSPPYFGLRSYDEFSVVIDPNLSPDKRDFVLAELIKRGICAK